MYFVQLLKSVQQATGQFSNATDNATATSIAIGSYYLLYTARYLRVVVSDFFFVVL